MKKGILYTILACLVGAFFLTLMLLDGGVQSPLRRAAKAELEKTPAYEGVDVKFSAQEAHVTGDVLRGTDLDAIENTVRESISQTGFGKTMSGVTRVHMNVAEFDPIRPWAGLSATPDQLRLRGVVENAALKSQLQDAAAAAYNIRADDIDNQISVNRRATGSVELGATATTFPAIPTSKVGPRAVLASAWIGEPWDNKALDGDLSALTGRLDPQVPADGSRVALAEPALAANAKWNQLQSLPAPFAGLIGYGDKTTLFGQVREPVTRNQLVAQAKARFPQSTIEDRMTVTGAVRYAPIDFSPTLDSMPNAQAVKDPHGLIASTEVGKSWTTHDASKRDELPSNLNIGWDAYTGPLWAYQDGAAERETARLAELAKQAEAAKAARAAAQMEAEKTAQAEAALAQAEADKLPKLTSEELAKLPPPYASLIASENVVKLNGAVADQATAQSLRAKIGTQFPGYQLVDNLKVQRNKIRPVQDIQTTIDTLPAAPGPDAGGRLVATTRVGYGWRSGTVHTIYFELNQGGGSDDQQRALAQVRRILEIVPDAAFEVVGHTDSQGGEDGNLRLSQRRAKTFADFLTGAGIEAGKVSHRGAGELEPAATNDTDLGRAKNRRVEILIR